MSLLSRLFGQGKKTSQGDVEAQLTSWLADERVELKNAIRAAIQAHAEHLQTQYDDLYGYAILPGEPYEVNELVAVFNRESDVKEDSAYYRFCVDEWGNWDHDALSAVTPLIAELNQQFRSLHPEDPENLQMDRHELTHIASFHNAILAALRELVEEGLFPTDPDKRFVAIWVSDSDHEIIAKSVRQLNSQAVTQEFMKEFGQ